jgi:hypothetical protein
MMTPTQVVRMIGIAGLVGWMGMVGWVAKTTQAQNGGQAPAPLPPVATKDDLPQSGSETPKARRNDAPEPLPVAPDSGAPSAPDPSPSPPPPLPTSPAQLESAEPASGSPVSHRPSAHSENQPTTSIDDPEQSAQSFVERNQKEAEDHLKALTAEAHQLRGRLAKLESGIKKWQGLVNALKSSQGQSIAPSSNVPGAEDAGDLEPIKPSQTGDARTEKRVKWATSTSGAFVAQPRELVHPPQQLPPGQPVPGVLEGVVVPAPR